MPVGVWKKENFLTLGPWLFIGFAGEAEEMTDWRIFLFSKMSHLDTRKKVCTFLLKSLLKLGVKNCDTSEETCSMYIYIYIWYKPTCASTCHGWSTCNAIPALGYKNLLMLLGVQSFVKWCLSWSNRGGAQLPCFAPQIWVVDPCWNQRSLSQNLFW